MGALTVTLRRADSNNTFADVYMQSMTPLIKMAAESDETLDKALDKRLPEEVDTVPSTLVAGKMVSAKGVLYIGGPTGTPVKVTYSHPTSSGNKHLPAGGTKGQYLTNADGEGGGAWADLPTASTTNSGIVQLSDGVTVADSTKAATANAVKKAYDKANHDHPYVPTTQVGAKNGVAPLDENGVISATYLPSYVDDVVDGTISEDLLSFTNTDNVVVEPETGKIYNDTTKNKSYRWSGTKYVSLNDGVALGETASTAYYGDKGKVAYEHSQSAHARTDATKTEKSTTNGSVKINGSDVVVYTHPTDAGNKHLPSGGAANQYIKYSAAGTGAWQSPDNTPTADSNNLITSGAVATMKSGLDTDIAGKASKDHTHTKADIGLGNVENKSSATIRSEITSKNVTDGLGYTPAHDTDMKGATSTEAGAHGLVPAPTTEQTGLYLRGDGKWATPTNTTYAEATSTAHGLMSTTDKQKLDGIADNANNYVHPSYTSKGNGLYKITVDNEGHVSATAAVAKEDITSLGIPAQDTIYKHPSYTAQAAGLYKVTVDELGHVSAAVAVEKADITKLGIPSSDTTYDTVTDTANGLMTSDMKKKLDDVEDGANKTIVSTSITQGDANPVSGGAVWSALGNKANASSLSSKQDKLSGTAGQFVGFDANGVATAVTPDITKSSADTAYVAKTGSTMTGDLTTTGVTVSKIADLGAAASSFAVLNANGTLYKRTKTEVISDLGVATEASPALTGTPTTPTPASNAGDTQIANVKYVKDAVGALLGQKDAFVFMGTITIGGTLPAADAGHVYRVVAADDVTKGTISGLAVCADDTITCFADSTKAKDSSNWFVTHTNHDGMVSGPTTSTEKHIAVFGDTSGKNIVDSGFTIAKSVPSDAKFSDTVYTHPSFTSKTSGLYKITVNDQGHVSAATAVTKSDITGLGIPGQDTVYSHPTHTAKTSGLYKITVDSLGHVSAATAVVKSDITGLGIPASDTTYSAATTTTAGLMSSDDKTKLNDIEAGANKTTVATNITQNGTNPVTSGAIWTALNDKASAASVSGKQDKLSGTAGQYVGFDENGMAVAVDPDISKAIADAAYIAKTGDKMTGDLTVGSASIQTNGHVNATWFKTSSTSRLGSVPNRYVVLDSSGWLYYRNQADMVGDIGAAPANSVIAEAFSSEQPTDQKTGDYWYEPISAVNS